MYMAVFSTTCFSTRIKISQPETQLLQLGYDAAESDAPFKLQSGDPVLTICITIPTHIYWIKTIKLGLKDKLFVRLQLLQLGYDAAESDAPFKLQSGDPVLTICITIPTHIYWIKTIKLGLKDKLFVRLQLLQLGYDAAESDAPFKLQSGDPVLTICITIPTHIYWIKTIKLGLKDKLFVRLQLLQLGYDAAESDAPFKLQSGDPVLTICITIPTHIYWIKTIKLGLKDKLFVRLNSY